MRRDRTPLNRRSSFINRRKRSKEFGSDGGSGGRGLGAVMCWRKRKGKVRKLRRVVVVVLGGFEEVRLGLVAGYFG